MAELDNTKDLYLSNDAVKRLIELLIDEISTRMPVLASLIPSTAEEANDATVKDNVPTVLAVFNALAKWDHIKFRMLKGAPNQSFESFMESRTPEEMALYLYRTADTPNFDLWVYDATQGYARVGHDSIPAGELGLADYWKKSELDINAYWSKDELSIEDFVTADALKEYVKTTDLEGYVKKEDIGTMTEEQIEAIFQEVKSAKA